ncbi:hypothetical protein A3A60_04480 [Candidatus Curtissbacteria bacterium RIFCSPLOWO2_01_FULL_42_26]|uniref:TrpR like protein, YerC/YecD n=1 Tax=Candidatus Curtissbacteria bacterium RIFCSPLOWO2_01_FULL_42_26 TaxID=1797729 RepID=A0A1F5HWZ8_9BACT|nr:MAG: hypothetical protein A3A60_04480 [Candidatus Curtissbacteria bacterium RIFCSPLOWO2_01_FULL_42_26]
MSKVSRRFLDKRLEKYIFDLFTSAVHNLSHPSNIDSFLADLLSPVEKIMLVKRLAIAIMISKGYTYDEIDHTLKVSRPTIMTVSRVLKYGHKNGYLKVIDQLLKDQRREAIFDKIEEILIALSPPKLYRSPTYERKRRIGKELFIRKKLRESI